MTPFNPQRFRERSAVVEAVQLTDDADWDAIAAWCGGVHEVGFDVTGEATRRIVVPRLGDYLDAYEGDWIFSGDTTHGFMVEGDEEWRRQGFEPVASNESERSVSVGSNLDAVMAELARLVTAEYERDEPRERVVQRIVSAASRLAGCRQEFEMLEIAPDRLAGVRDAVRFGKEGERNKTAK